MVKQKVLAGATVVKEELKDEAKEKMISSKGSSGSIETFLQAMKEQEEAQREATSADLEIIKDVSPRQLLELQGINEKGEAIGKPARLYGYDPKTKTALVLKEAFLGKLNKKLATAKDEGALKGKGKDKRKGKGKK